MNVPSPTSGPILTGHDFSDAVAQLLELDRDLDIIPAASRDEIITALNRMVERAEFIHFVSTADVIKNCRGLIAAAASVDIQTLNEYLPAETASVVHLHRNILLAAVLAGSKGSFSKGDAEKLCVRFPRLRERTHGYTRPNTDDETLLMRVWALTLSEVGGRNGRRSAAVYAQCDAGLCAGETTMIQTDDLDLTPNNGMLQAPGLDVGVRDRVIPLDPFNIRVLTTYMEDVPAAGLVPLTYRGRRDAYNYVRAACSVDGILNRQRAAVGLKHRDTTASSITMWRAQHTEDILGVAAAVEISGRTNATNHWGLMRNRVNPHQVATKASRKQQHLDI